MKRRNDLDSESLVDPLVRAFEMGKEIAVRHSDLAATAEEYSVFWDISNKISDVPTGHGSFL